MSKDLPHVTKIIDQLDKPALVQWASNVGVEYIKNHLLDNPDKLKGMDVKEIVKAAKAHHKKMKEEAGDFGKRTHQAIERFLKAKDNSEIEVDEDIAIPFKKFVDWFIFNEVEPIEVECAIWSEDGGGYKGTFDLAAYIKKKDKKILYVVDFKTSGGIYDSSYMQLAAYFYGWKQRTAFIPERAAILRLEKDEAKESEFFEMLEHEVYHHYKRFISLTEYWHITNGDQPLPF